MKMNLNAVDVDLLDQDISSYLSHYGMKGQRKGVFCVSGATRYQNHAVYAKWEPRYERVAGRFSVQDTKQHSPLVNTGKDDDTASKRELTRKQRKENIKKDLLGTRKNRETFLEAIKSNDPSKIKNRQIIVPRQNLKT